MINLIVVLNLVQKEYGIIQSNYNQKNSLRILEQSLWKDMSLHAAFYNPKNKELACMNLKDTVTYQFKKDYVIRNSDTLTVTIDSIHIFSKENLAINRIDAIELTLNKSLNHQKLFINKNNSAEFYVTQ
ncbi:hypothetical protein [uncultured Lutibacter sp.]|uniref:hypothetical protein n=1 Tax=uncultured Lutibacter sp. TaxID=437739 RepID=UPI00260D1BE7|nr:hypothetical protein [uncultured Lutibacter sp.]